ncbi:hypothetical protein OXX79_009290 [Metschnikowia pulcherrima]
MNLKSFFSSVASSSFIINSLLSNETIAGPGSGRVSVPLVMVDGFLSKREANAPSVTITSADNYKTLKELEHILKNRDNVETGERLYLESVFMHNGYPERVNDVNNGDFADYLYNYKKLTQAEITSFANHTSTPGIKELFEYAAEKTSPAGTIQGADCSEIYSTDNDDCSALQKFIKSRWWSSSVSGSWCSGSCCASWSNNASYKVGAVKSRISQCQASCSSAGKGCKIFEADLQGKTKPDFCLGAVAACT